MAQRTQSKTRSPGTIRVDPVIKHGRDFGPGEEQRQRDQVKDGNEAQAAGKERGEKLKDDIDGLLSDIDSVLEENAEEFVNSYRQKGGQ